MTTTVTASTRRMDKKRRRTRMDLLEATSTELVERGFEAVMIDDITARADVGRRTFYNYFESKEACVLAALSKRYDDHVQTLERSLDIPPPPEVPADSDHARIIATLAARMFLLVSHDAVTARLLDYPRILSEAISDSQRDHLLGHLANGVVAGRLTPSLPPASLEPIIAWGFVGLLVTAVRRKSQATDSLHWACFLLQNLGIPAAEARALVDEIAD